MHIGSHLADRRAPRGVAARRSRQPKPQVQVFGVVQPIDHPKLEHFDEIDLAGRHKPGKATWQVATVPGEVREPDQRVRLRMDPAEGDVVEIVSGGVANHGLEVQANDVPEGTPRILLAGHEGEIASLHPELFAKAGLGELGAGVMPHFEEVDHMHVLGQGILH